VRVAALRLAENARVRGVEHFGRDVVGGADHGLHAADGRAVLGRQAKVDELDVRVDVLALKDEIFELEVAVRNAHVMAVGDGRHHLEHQPRRLGLGVPAARLHVQPVKELAAVAQLEHEVEVGRVLVVLVQLDDVWVVQHLQQPDLVAQVVQQLRLNAPHLHALERVDLARACGGGGRARWGARARAQLGARAAAAGAHPCA